MRRIRYQVAISLDGYVPGPNGEFDWIVRTRRLISRRYSSNLTRCLSAQNVRDHGATWKYNGSRDEEH